MPFSSPGPGAFLWSASLPPQELPVDLFLRNGISSVPVAIVPNNEGVIRMKNPKVIQAELRSATAHFHSITEVRQFGKGGILCFSSDQLCVRDLLKCSVFATNPVSAFIPPHLACVKGLVRGVDVNMTPAEVLEMFSEAGAIAVYRCGRVVDKNKVPTESVIVTFAGSSRPTEIKAWPLIYRVEPLSPRPLQCLKCWRYGHTIKGCRSAPRCRICGEAHNAHECKSNEEKCCLCHEAHCADNPDCSAKAREMQILEIVDRRRCSRKDAIAEIQTRTQGYAGAAARHNITMEASLSLSIADMIEKAMEKAMQRLATTLCESLSHIIANQMAHVCDTSRDMGTASQNDEISYIRSETDSEKTASNAQPAGSSRGGVQRQSDVIPDDNQDSDDMDMDLKSLKRSRSPISKKSGSPKHSKSKKYQKDNLSKSDFLKESILDKAVADSILS